MGRGTFKRLKVEMKAEPSYIADTPLLQLNFLKRTALIDNSQKRIQTRLD